MKKICMKCGKSMSLEKFPTRGTKVDGSPSYRNYCRTCWNEIRRLREGKHLVEETKDEDYTEILIKALVEYTGFSTEALDACTKEEFVKYTGYTEDFSFTDLKEKAFQYLDNIGVGNPASISFTENGNYLVVGDTYGQHTRTGMFTLLNNICAEYNVKTLIFVGKQLDENDTISNCFEDLICENIVFVASPEEISTIHKYNKNIGGMIVRDFVKVGNTIIRNQEQISPYVKKSIASLDSLLFPDNTIVNCTRTEYAVRSAGTSTSFIASPGALAEPFVPKLHNKLLIKGGIRVAQVYSHSFKKYRKAEEDKRLWEQGCILLMKKGSITQCGFLPIKVVNGIYTTAFAGVVINEYGSLRPDSITVVVSDIHAPYYCKETFGAFLSYVESNYARMSEIVCAGDIVDCRSVNPHILNRGEIPTESVSETFFAMNDVLLNISDCMDTGDITVMSGNHSDFVQRWSAKNPQFKKLLSGVMDSIVSDYASYIVATDDYHCTGENSIVLHGNTAVANGGTNNTEKYARAFSNYDAIVIGHSHSTNIRMGCLRVGCLCNFNQGYNSPYGAWDHSFAVITTVDGVDFASPLFITDGFILDGISTYTDEGRILKHAETLTVTLGRD